MADYVRTSVSLYQPEVEFLNRSGQGQSVQLRRDLTALAKLLAVPPDFSEDEWVYLRQVLKGWVFEPSHVRSLPAMLAQEVADAVATGDLDHEALALSKRLAIMHPADAWAVVDLVLRFWAHVETEAAGEA